MPDLDHLEAGLTLAPAEDIYPHFRFNMLMYRCDRKRATIQDCQLSGGWCDICRMAMPNQINPADPHQFFLIDEDQPEDYRNEKYDYEQCAGLIGVLPMVVS